MGCFRQHERIVANLARFVDLLLLCPDRGEGELRQAMTASMAAGTADASSKNLIASCGLPRFR